MFGFTSRRRRAGNGPYGMDTTHHTTTRTTTRRRGIFHRRNPERRAAGLKVGFF